MFDEAVIASSTPPTTCPICPLGAEPAASDSAAVRDSFGEPVIEPELCGVRLLGEIRIGCFADHEMAAWREHAPDLAQDRRPLTLADVLDHAINEDEGKAAVRKR